jgi:amphi-Trp domain-containing protein
MEFRDEERLGRRQAAERLADIAYALTAGLTLELRDGVGRVSVPVPDEVVLRRTSTSTGGRVHVELELSWSASPSPPTSHQPQGQEHD